MTNGINTITQLNLKSFGLSNYLVREIVKNLNANQTINGLKEYSIDTIKASIALKLSSSRIQPKTREKLQRVLAWLGGESNVIEVDFLRNLAPEKRIEVLNSRIEELKIQEIEINHETNTLLRKAEKMLKKQQL